jgi:uncharacterized protein YhbP (UPF0306 family)
MKISKQELRKLILDYLAENKVASLATSKDNIPWAAPVLYAYDSDLNLYFISEPDTRKIQNILSNPKVAVTIAEVRYKERKMVGIGIQLEGEAYQIEKEKGERELAIFRKRYRRVDEYLPNHELFVVRPSKIIFQDDERFGPGGKEELVLE